MLKAVHAQEDKEADMKKELLFEKKITALNFKEAARIFSLGINETLTYMQFPMEHWRKIRTNNPMEIIIREICRRTRVVGSFPDGRSTLMLVTARLRYITAHSWGLKKYMNTNLLYEVKENVA